MENRKWSAIPATRSNALSLKVKQRVVIAILLFLSILGPISLVISVTKSPTPIVKDSGSYIGEDTSIAKLAIIEWLSNKVPSVTYNSDLAEQIKPVDKPISNQVFIDFLSSNEFVYKDKVYKIHKFVLNFNSALYVASVTTSFFDGYVEVVAGPSLLPYYQSISTSDRLDYTSDLQESVSPDVRDAINSWAKSFVENDSDGLKLSTNDNQEYVGLDGFSLIGQPRILSFTKDISNVNGYIARVSMRISPLGAKQLELSVEYDTLVINDGNSIPHIVAWGSAGNKQLTPYQNRK